MNRNFVALNVVAFLFTVLAPDARAETPILIHWKTDRAAELKFDSKKGEYLVHRGNIPSACHASQNGAPLPIAPDGGFELITRVREASGHSDLFIQCFEASDRWIFEYRWKKQSPFFTVLFDGEKKIFH